MLLYISKIRFVFQQVIIVHKHGSINREFSVFKKTVLSQPRENQGGFHFTARKTSPLQKAPQPIRLLYFH
jgi:hypothetical protein